MYPFGCLSNFLHLLIAKNGETLQWTCRIYTQTTFPLVGHDIIIAIIPNYHLMNVVIQLSCFKRKWLQQENAPYENLENYE